MLKKADWKRQKEGNRVAKDREFSVKGGRHCWTPKTANYSKGLLGARRRFSG